MNKTIITISRETGSGGHSIGKMLAEKLGYAFYDKEIVNKTAIEMGIDAETISENGENISDNTFINLISGFVPLSRKKSIPIDSIQQYQSKLIKNIAEKGNCIIVGRNSDYILKDNPKAFHIFIHADLKHRVNRVAKRENIVGQDDRIARELKVKDKSRGAYYQYYTDRPWGVVSNYNMMLDTSIFSEEQCCEIIINALKITGGNKNA